MAPPKKLGFTRKQDLLTRGAAMMMAFNASQAPQLEDRGRDESEQVTDSSDLSETKPSPLERPTSSYTQPTETEETESGDVSFPSTVMEMQEQRQREARMKETAEQFVGAPTTPSAEERTPSEQPQEQKRKASTQEATSGGDELAQAQAMRDAQAAESRRQNQIQQSQAATQQSAAQGSEAERQALKNIWRFMNGTDTLTAEDVVGGILVIGMMNAQLINQYVFHHELVPELDLPEVSFIVCIDCCLAIVCPVILAGCFIQLGLLAGVGGLLSSVVDAVSGLVGG